MGLDQILSRLALHVPRKVSPEWGCGGVFGLLYTGEVLYYTLAFEAEAYFYHVDGVVRKYGFEKVGSPPRSGGDTYNASVSVDDSIYFGGWVHAPARYRSSSRGLGEVVFSNKYSHVHEYNVAEREVRLVWAEMGTDPRYWVGEVTDLLYNPLRDSLILARGDGHVNLGVYEVDRRSGKARRIDATRVLRGAIYMDHACFSIHQGWGGRPGIICLGLESYKRHVAGIESVEEASSDGGGVYLYRSGDVAAIDTWLAVLMRGGIAFYDPLGGEKPWFARLLDFHYSPYGPLRSNTLAVGGGLLAAFNASSHSTVLGTDELPGEQQRGARKPPTQTLLVYIAPPVARVVAALGARVTSLALGGPYILAATSTCPNLERYDSTRVDHSVKSVLALGHDVVYARPPPVTITVPGWLVEDKHWGGIPLTGYRDAVLEITSEKGGTVEAYSYDLYTGPGGAERDRYDVEKGRTVIDLASQRGLIVSFRLRNPLHRATIRLLLG